jgi:hypothetical protein
VDKSDIVLLLAFAGTYDYRKTGDADVEAWFLAVGDLSFDDAKQAVVAHYRNTDVRMMPFHLRQGVKAIKDERRRAEPSDARELPSRFEDDEDRTDRARRGSAQVHGVIAELAQRMQDRGEHIPGEAMDRLREITDGPAWAEIEGSNR